MLRLFTSALLAAFIASFVGATASSARAADSLVVATYNIRYDSREDAARGDGWATRKAQVAGLIRFHEFDVFGLQEVTAGQLADLGAMEEFAHVGVGRDDGKAGGEFSPVFWRKNRFELLASGTFWLSLAPERPGLAWDAAFPRICTWVKLRDARTARVFHFFNTHFDHVGVEARKRSAELILARLQPALDAGEPVILVGDFNVTPETEPYAVLAKKLTDARTISRLAPYGPKGTFNAFNYTGEVPDRIDHVFVSAGIAVEKHGTLSDSVNRRFPSDHFPVVARVVLPK